MVPKGKNRIKQIEPLKNVHERIEKSLEAKKRSEKMKSWEKQLLDESGFKINESELEGKK